MNELSRIQFQTTQDYSNYFSGRLLHRALEIKTPYRKWFPRVCAQNDYEEGVDFVTSDKIVRRADGVPMNKGHALAPLCGYPWRRKETGPP